jgi:DNA-directed RNA polymerase specialized sigma subunit
MPYDKAHNLDLLRDYKRTGRPRTLDALIRYNEGLVLKKARTVSDKTPGLDFDDAYQQGMLGLVKAVEGFELNRVYVAKDGSTREIQFSTYAGRIIWGEIMHYMRDKLHVVRPPRAWLDKRRRLLDLWDSGAPLDAIAEATGIPQCDIPQAVHAVRLLPTVSLDQPCGEGGDTIGGLLAGAHSGQVLNSCEDLLMAANAAIAVDGYFDLSQLCRDYGRMPGNYLTLASTKAKAEKLEKIAGANVFKVKRGRGGRVLAHKAIAPHFLLWLHREKFEPLIDQALLANLEVLAG